MSAVQDSVVYQWRQGVLTALAIVPKPSASAAVGGSRTASSRITTQVGSVGLV